jgi:hypothetical protein
VRSKEGEKELERKEDTEKGKKGEKEIEYNGKKSKKLKDRSWNFLVIHSLFFLVVCQGQNDWV